MSFEQTKYSFHTSFHVFQEEVDSHSILLELFISRKKNANSESLPSLSFLLIFNGKPLSLYSVNKIAFWSVLYINAHYEHFGALST